MLRTTIRVATFVAAYTLAPLGAQSEPCSDTFSAASFYQYVAIEDALWLKGDPALAARLAAEFLADERNCREQAEAVRLMEIAQSQLTRGASMVGPGGPSGDPATSQTATPPPGQSESDKNDGECTTLSDGDRDARPVSPPVPSYPTAALAAGVQGRCDVRFDVDAQGRPYNVEAACSDLVFKRESEIAVGKARFAPKVCGGQPVELLNVVYPLKFQLAE